MHRRSIELRNHLSGVPSLLDDGEGNTGECATRVLIRLPGVRDLWHVHKLHERESGELGSECLCPGGSPAGEGQGRNPGMYTFEQSDRPIVPEKPSNKASSIIAIWPQSGGDGGGKGPDRGEPV